MIITITDEQDQEIEVKIYFNSWDELTYDSASHSPKQKKCIEKYLRDYKQETEVLLWQYIQEQTKGMHDDC